MEIIVKSLTEKGFEDRDYRQVLLIEIDGKKSFIVADGEPEDSNLSRDFNDCCRIPNLMKKAYEAGKNSEKFDIRFIELDEI